MLELNVQTQRIDGGTLTETIKNYLMDAMERAADKLIELMREEVQRTVEGYGPGKPAWRGKLAEDIRVVFRDVVNDAIEFGVGADYSEGTWEHVRAMQIAYGGGSAAGNAEIQAGPYGREVWNEDLSGKHPSSAQSEYFLPGRFNQPGNDYQKNAMLRMKVFFDDILNDAIRNMPDSVLGKAVYVTQ